MAGLANRVKNGGFETGVDGWVVSHGTRAATTPGHSSAGAAKWSPDGTADSVLTLDAPVLEAPVDGNWCAQAWVQGTDGKDVDLQVLRNLELYDTATVSASGGIWTRAQANVMSLFSEPISLQLRSPADAGVRQLLVDDVALWQDVSGAGCAAVP